MKTYCHTYLTTSLTCLLLLLPLPASGSKDTPPPPIEVNFHAFSNGLGLYHARVEEATKFQLSVTVWVGSVNEDPEENAGVSHLLEHILFHQQDMPEAEFNAQINSQGGTFNAMTSEDYTYYYVTLPTQYLKLGQNWLHKVLFHDRLVTDRLDQEKEIVNRENGWPSSDSGDDQLPGFWERYFGLPEYDEPVGGTYKVASKLTATQLEAHYRTYYYPENMVLLYVGPHELKDVLAAVRSTFRSVPSTGRKAQLTSILENVSPRPYFDHELADGDYKIKIGHVSTGFRFSERSKRHLYSVVIRQLLEERFRYEEGKTYGVSRQFDYYRGAGYFQFGLEASPETYWAQLKEVKELVWGDLGEHLSQEDYERYKTTFLEQVASSREVGDIHDRIWGSIYQHPLHRPSPQETDTYGPMRSLSYHEFLGWVRNWRAQTAPLLELSMPAVPFTNGLVLWALGIVLGVYLARSLLRRRPARENVKLSTRVPYGMTARIQVGFFYVSAAILYTLFSEVLEYGTVSFSYVNSLAMVKPYFAEISDGMLIGLCIVIGGLIIPRDLVVTDRSLVLKMRSSLSFRIPLQDIERVEPIDGYAALERVLRREALPFFAWFSQGLVIHRKSGRSVVLHTYNDTDLQNLLAFQSVADPPVSAPTAATTALISN